MARLVFWYALFWTGLSVFFASQIILLERRATWGQALAFSMPRWYVWGLLTPAILWLDRRLGRGRSLGWRVAMHVPLAVAWTLLSIVLRLVTRPLRGSPWPANIAEFFLERFYWDLLIYAVIAGVSIARDFAAQATARERQAHELALEAADLERRLTEARLQSLRAQLQPHFLFNALNTISAFTETSPRTARRLMEQLGDLLRASLTLASRPVVPLREELTFLDNYLAIEAARFEGRISAGVHVADGLLGYQVPSFLLQPLVENAIRHGVAPRLSGGRVEVTIARAGSSLEVRVRDDGVGLPDDWRLDRDARVGLGNIASRLEHLYGRGDLLRISRRATGGVDVELSLPLRSSAKSSTVEQTADAPA